MQEKRDWKSDNDQLVKRASERANVKLVLADPVYDSRENLKPKESSPASRSSVGHRARRGAAGRGDARRVIF